MKKILQKISLGQVITDREQKKIYVYLGFRFSFLRFFVFFIFIVCGFSLIVWSFLLEEFAQRAVFISGFAVILAVLCCSLSNCKYKRLIKYFDALNIFVEHKFATYKGFSAYYVKNIVCTNNGIETNKVYFLTDGFNFMIFEDFLEITKYLLPSKIKANMRMCLPIINYDIVDRKPMIFTYNDISSYKLEGKQNPTIEIEKSRRLSSKINQKIQDNDLLLDQALIHDNYVSLFFNDGTIIKLDTNIYDVVYDLIPLKEKA